MTTTSKHRCVFFDDESAEEASCACGERALRLLVEDGTELLVRLESAAAVEVTVGAFGERPAHLAVSA